MLQVFMEAIEAITKSIPFDNKSIEDLKQEAHKSFVEMYNHADLTPTQAQELARIYVNLYLTQEEYLRLNKEFSKYTAK